MYSRRPTSMAACVAADRTVQRGCEPKAMDPSKERSRDGKDSSSSAILAQIMDFSMTRTPHPQIESGVGEFPIAVPAQAGTHSSASRKFRATAMSYLPLSARAAEAWTPACAGVASRETAGCVHDLAYSYSLRK